MNGRCVNCSLSQRRGSPQDLALELSHYLETIDGAPTAWLFPSTQKHVPLRPANFLRRVLKPAAIPANVATIADAKREKIAAVNFQSLRRRSSTLFGARPKDPKLNQAHMQACRSACHAETLPAGHSSRSEGRGHRAGVRTPGSAAEG